VKFHSTALRAEGGEPEEVHEVLGVPGLRGTRLTRREVLMLQFCRQAALDANAITDEQVAELKAEGLTDADIVEMIETMSFTTAHTKLVDALAIEPDPWLQ
jgi:alkylhydroperoxidase family enzyme